MRCWRNPRWTGPNTAGPSRWRLPCPPAVPLAGTNSRPPSIPSGSSSSSGDRNPSAWGFREICHRRHPVHHQRPQDLPPRHAGVRASSRGPAIRRRTWSPGSASSAIGQGPRAEPAALPLLVSAGGGVSWRRTNSGFYLPGRDLLAQPVHHPRRRQAGGPVGRTTRPIASSKTYGNHPSFVLMAHGNEPGGKQANALSRRLGGALPRRWTRAGCGPAERAGRNCPRTSSTSRPDPRIQQWGAGLKSRINAPAAGDDDRLPRLHRLSASVPVISHEIGQWCVYPNFDEIPKYTGYLKPRNFEIFRDRLRAARHGRPGPAVPARLGQAADAVLQGGHRVRPAHAGHGRIPVARPARFPGPGHRAGRACSIRSGRRRATSPPRSTAGSATRTVPLARLRNGCSPPTTGWRRMIEIAHFGAAPLPDAVVGWRTHPARRHQPGGRPLPRADHPGRQWDRDRDDRRRPPGGLRPGSVPAGGLLVRNPTRERVGPLGVSRPGPRRRLHRDVLVTVRIRRCAHALAWRPAASCS